MQQEKTLKDPKGFPVSPLMLKPRDSYDSDDQMAALPSPMIFFLGGILKNHRAE